MLKKDEAYFEIRYLKNIPFLYALLSTLLALDLLIDVFEDWTVLDLWSITGSLCAALGLLGWAIYYYFSKTRQRIVFDHGRITLYMGNKIKITGTLDQSKAINRPRAGVTGVGAGGLGATQSTPYQIVFEWGGVIKTGKFIDFGVNMDNSYKLVALLEKGGYFEKNKDKKE